VVRRLQRAARLLLALPLFSVLPVSGQSQDSAIEQSRLFQNTQSPATGRMTPDGTLLPATDSSGAQDDSFGIQQVLKDNPKVTHWMVAGGGSLFYTSNAALTRSNTISDGFGVGTASVTWASKIGQQWELQAGAGAALFRYFDTTDLDFESLATGVGLTWAPPGTGGVSFFGRYDFTELLDASSHQILSDNEFTLGAQKTFVLGRSHALSLGVAGSAGISDPFSAQRDLLGFFVGYQLRLTRNVEADFLYRFGYYFYNDGDRRDVNNVISASVTYHVNQWASVVGFLSWGDNSSNRSAFDYQVFTGGGGVALNVKF
jgi:hypothetical protein